jgi:ATP-dependent protease ClpP protease subunit
MPDMFRLGYSVKMQAGSGDTAEVMLYGEIINDMPKWWKWSDEDKSAADFDKAIKDAINQGATKLLLRINSPGGVCTQATAMRSILANAGFDEITIRIEGMCASAATTLATLPGAHVAIAEGSEYMIHNPMCMAYGNANEMENVISRLRNIEQMTRGFYMKRTGQSEEQVKKWMDEETWFTADETVQYGFADEVLSAEVATETPISACVSSREMETMRALYKAVPNQITTVNPQNEQAMKKPADNASNGAPVAGAATENKPNKEDHSTMTNEEIKEITMDQLREGNPDLYTQVRQDAVNAEHARLEDIDALTVPGYEEMAAEAKKAGTSAMDFQRQLVAAMKQKGSDFISQRQKETAPAQNITGGAPGGSTKTEEQEIQDNAKDIAAYASGFSGNASNGMF